MKLLTFSFATFALLGGTLSSQPTDTDASLPAAVSPVRTEEQLDALLGPIALYPDALIAVILPASTVPSDIVLATRFLQANGRNAAVDTQSWDGSVKSLASYPEVITWMDENLAWTKQLGEAFAAQPAEVMKAIQRLRARARAVGTLQDTPQQKVIVEGDTIALQPAEDNVIYVPRYDPQVVYLDRPYDYYSGPFISFGIGFPVIGGWGYGCDWRSDAIWVGPARGGVAWHSIPNRAPAGSHVWVPPARHFHSAAVVTATQRTEIVHPYPFGRGPTEEYARLHNEHVNRPWNQSPEAAVNPYRHTATAQTVSSQAPAAPVPTPTPAPSAQRAEERTRVREYYNGERREGAPPVAVRVQPSHNPPATQQATAPAPAARIYVPRAAPASSAAPAAPVRVQAPAPAPVPQAPRQAAPPPAADSSARSGRNPGDAPGYRARS